MQISSEKPDPRFVWSGLTDCYVYKVQTPFGERVVNTHCTNLREAKTVVNESMAKQLEIAAKAMRLTNEVISQMTRGKKDLRIEEAFVEFFEWRSQNYSPNGMGCLITHLKRSIIQMDLVGGFVSDITEERLNHNINPDDDNVCESQRNRRLSFWRQFFSWLSSKYPYPNTAALIRVQTHKLTMVHRKNAKPHRLIPDDEFERCMTWLWMEYHQAQLDRKERLHGAMLTNKRVGMDKINHRIEMATFHLFAFVVARYTGLRFGDIACMEWASLEGKSTKEGFGRQIEVWTKKTNCRIEMPMCERIQQVLLIVPRTDKYLFPRVQSEYAYLRRTGKSYQINFYRELEHIYGGAGVPKLSWHDFRHTFATEVEKKYGITLASQWLGHKSVAQTEQYVHRPMQIGPVSVQPVAAMPEEAMG